MYVMSAKTPTRGPRRRPVTVLPRIHAQLVDTRWRLRQNVDGVAGGVHVVQEVDGQGGEGEHQHPQHGQYVRQHYEL